MRASDGDQGAYGKVVHFFHELRNQLTVMTNTAEFLADSTLTDEQSGHVEQMRTATLNLENLLNESEDVLLAALALSPAARGPILTVPCLRNGTVATDVLGCALSDLHQVLSLVDMGSAIVVAPGELLYKLRPCFTRSGWRPRQVTLPIDVASLLNAEPAHLIALAPPADEAVAWWRTLHMALHHFKFSPTLMHLIPIDGDSA